MNRQFVYIVNPISGTRTKKDLEAFLARETRAAGIPFQVFPSVASGDYRFLDGYIRENGVTDIVIAGGDGTVSQVVGSLMKHEVNFGIIPCGSGNGLAYAAGIPKQPAKALKIVLEGRSLLTDGFRINGRFACMLAGLGFDAKVAHDFAQQPKRGLSTYVNQVFRNFLSAKTYPFQLRMNRRKLETEAYFLSIANSNQYGNNFTIAPQASLRDGLIDVVIATEQSKLAMLLETFKQVSGFNKLMPESAIDRKKGVIYFQTRSLKISNPGQAPLHIDGDPAETPEEVEIDVLPKAFRLLQPLP